LIDPNAELTPGLKAWYDRNQSVLGEFWVWTPVAMFVCLWVTLVPGTVRDTPPFQVLKNAATVGVSGFFPIFAMVMHPVGFVFMFVGAATRAFSHHHRGLLALHGILVTLSSSLGYGWLADTGHLMISEKGRVKLVMYAAMSLGWTVLWMYRYWSATQEARVDRLEL